MHVESVSKRVPELQKHTDLPVIIPSYEVRKHPMLKGAISGDDFELFVKIHSRLIEDLTKQQNTGVEGVRITDPAIFRDSVQFGFRLAINTIREEAQIRDVQSDFSHQIRSVEIAFQVWDSVSHGNTPIPHERILRTSRLIRKSIEINPEGTIARDLSEFESEMSSILAEIDFESIISSGIPYISQIKQCFEIIDSKWNSKSRSEEQNKLLFDWKIQYSDLVESHYRSVRKKTKQSPLVKVHNKKSQIIHEWDTKNLEKLETHRTKVKEFESTLSEIVDQIPNDIFENLESDDIVGIRNFFATIDSLWNQVERSDIQNRFLFDWKIDLAIRWEKRKINMANIARIRTRVPIGKRSKFERARYIQLKLAANDLEKWAETSKDDADNSPIRNVIDDVLPHQPDEFFSTIAKSHGLTPQAQQYIVDHPELAKDLHKAMALGAGMLLTRFIVGWTLVPAYYGIISKSETLARYIEDNIALNRVIMFASISAISFLRYKANVSALTKRGHTASPVAELMHIGDEMEKNSEIAKVNGKKRINTPALFSELFETYGWTYAGFTSWPFLYGLASEKWFTAFALSVATSLSIDQAYIRGRIPDVKRIFTKIRRENSAIDSAEDHA